MFEEVIYNFFGSLLFQKKNLPPPPLPSFCTGQERNNEHLQSNDLLSEGIFSLLILLTNLKWVHE